MCSAIRATPAAPPPAPTRRFAWAAAQVRAALETTQRLGGENYVLWGGREGYDSLLNTDLRRELDQYGRFLSMVVDHKHRIGFKGTILIEPKPFEPTKHQYDHDSAAVFAFLESTASPRRSRSTSRSITRRLRAWTSNMKSPSRAPMESSAPST